MTGQPQRSYSEEEYLELEREAGYKSEYFQGEKLAMAGASPNHNRITENLSGEIYVALKGGACRGFSSDQRIYIPSTGLYTYPDVLIVCGPNQYSDDKKDTITNPSVIVEVLSESTAGYDRGEKFHFYRSIPTLEEYVLIDSLAIAAEVFRKNEDGVWYLASEAYDIAGSISIGSLELTLRMSDVYGDTEDLIPVAVGL